MMVPRKPRAVQLLLLACAALACAEPSATSEKVAADSGAAVDAGRLGFDSDLARHPAQDSTVGQPDGRDAKDANHRSDANRENDAGRVSDASFVHDAGGVAEASRASDAGHVVDASPASDANSGANRGLRGAFLELSNARSADFYRSAVVEMAALGMDTAIIQTESYLQEPDFARNAVDRSLIHAVLEQANASGLRVHIGLPLPEWGNGDPSQATNSAFIDNTVAASKQSFDSLMQDFAGQPAWQGCYLPLELWTPGQDGELGELPRYVEELSKYVKQHSSLVVSLSPFISDLADDSGKAAERAFTAIVNASPVDIIALQDGVGARGLSIAELGANSRYYQALLTACENKCAVWANIEAFEKDLQTTASWDRFLSQMQTLAPLIPDQVSYEYTHYWMASGPGGTGAKALHDAYAAWLSTANR